MKSVRLFCLLFCILMVGCATTSPPLQTNLCIYDYESFRTTYHSEHKYISKNERTFSHGMDWHYYLEREDESVFISYRHGITYSVTKNGHFFDSTISSRCRSDFYDNASEYIPLYIPSPPDPTPGHSLSEDLNLKHETVCDEQNRPVLVSVYNVKDDEKSLMRTEYYHYDDRLQRVTEETSVDADDGSTDRIFYTYNDAGELISRKSIYINKDYYQEIKLDYALTLENLVKKYTRSRGFIYYKKVLSLIDIEVDYTYQNDRVFSYPELIKARTLFDKSPHAWESSPRPKPPEDLPLYNPDNPPPYAELIENFSEYQLDPAYAELEPEDYPEYECNSPMKHPDYAHPSRQFWMSPTEVTQGEFASRMGFNPSFFSACGDNCPVENVTWYQALAYANKASQDEGLEPCYVLKDCTELSKSCADVSFRGLDCRGYRLPTDEEWRYMAKKNGNYGDGDIRSPAYADRVELSAIEAVHGTAWQRMQEIAWGYENSSVEYENCRPIRRTYSGFFIRPKPPHAKQEIALDGFGYYPDCIGPHPVAQKQPDANGIYDFYGNVGEWVWDWYGHSRRSGDSLGPEIGICKIFRGGTSHDKIDDSDQPFYRPGCYLPERGGSVVGFRLVRTIDGYIAHDQNLP